MTDIELINRFIAGDESAFDLIVERHQKLVYGVCLRELFCPNLAEDAAQGTFILFYKKVKSLNSKRYTDLSGWFFHSARLVSKKLMREETARRRRERRAATRKVKENGSVTEGAAMSDSKHEKAEYVGHLNECLGSLGEADSQALIVYYLQGRTRAEAAEACNCNENTFKKRVAGALERLRKKLVKRGVVLSAAACAGLLQEEAVSAAPASLAGLCSYASIKGIISGAGGVGAGASAGVAGSSLSGAASASTATTSLAAKAAGSAMTSIFLSKLTAVVCIAILSAGAVFSLGLAGIKLFITSSGDGNKIIQALGEPKVNLCMTGKEVAEHLTVKIAEKVKEYDKSIYFRYDVDKATSSLCTFPVDRYPSEIDAYLASLKFEPECKREILYDIENRMIDYKRIGERNISDLDGSYVRTTSEEDLFELDSSIYKTVYMGMDRNDPAQVQASITELNNHLMPGTNEQAKWTMTVACEYWQRQNPLAFMYWPYAKYAPFSERLTSNNQRFDPLEDNSSESHIGVFVNCLGGFSWGSRDDKPKDYYISQTIWFSSDNNYMPKCRFELGLGILIPFSRIGTSQKYLDEQKVTFREHLENTLSVFARDGDDSVKVDDCVINGNVATIKLEKVLRSKYLSRVFYTREYGRTADGHIYPRIMYIIDNHGRVRKGKFFGETSATIHRIVVTDFRKNKDSLKGWMYPYDIYVNNNSDRTISKTGENARNKHLISYPSARLGGGDPDVF